MFLSDYIIINKNIYNIKDAFGFFPNGEEEIQWFRPRPEGTAILPGPRM